VPCRGEHREIISTQSAGCTLNWPYATHKWRLHFLRKAAKNTPQFEFGLVLTLLEQVLRHYLVTRCPGPEVVPLRYPQLHLPYLDPPRPAPRQNPSAMATAAARSQRRARPFPACDACGFAAKGTAPDHKVHVIDRHQSHGTRSHVIDHTGHGRNA
jgi:hypothetical protein